MTQDRRAFGPKPAGSRFRAYPRGPRLPREQGAKPSNPLKRKEVTLTLGTKVGTNGRKLGEL